MTVLNLRNNQRWTKIFGEIGLSDVCMTWILFFSLVFQRLAPVGFIIWIVFFAIESYQHGLHRHRGGANTGIWILLYYLWMVVALLWTENLGFALERLEIKLAFLLLPILFFYSPLVWIIKWWKEVFLIAACVSLLSNEAIGIARTDFNLKVFDTTYLRDSDFCLTMHRSYYASYLVIAVVLFFERIHFRRGSMGLNILAVLLFSIGVFQTVSKAGMLCLVGLIMAIALYLMSKNWKLGVGLIMLLLFGLIGLMNIQLGSAKIRFVSMLDAIGGVQLQGNPSVESNEARLIMWNTSLVVIKDNLWIGTGTGDYEDELVNQNLVFENNGVAKEKLNAHNQFLNTAVQLGLPGLLLLVLIFYQSFKSCNLSYFGYAILAVFCINFLFESFLETQAGIVLFTLFSLLISNKKVSE
jgi:O-antigen ligase